MNTQLNFNPKDHALTLPEASKGEPLQAAREAQKQTRRQILAVATEDQQRNMLAEWCELLTVKLDRPKQFTAEQQARIDAIQATWATIKALRAA